MRVEVLKGRDGRRWLRVEGSGRVVELATVEVVAKAIGKKSARKLRTK